MKIYKLSDAELIRMRTSLADQGDWETVEEIDNELSLRASDYESYRNESECRQIEEFGDFVELPML